MDVAIRMLTTALAPIDRAFDAWGLKDLIEHAGLEVVRMLNLGRQDPSLLPPVWRGRVAKLSTWQQIRLYELVDPAPQSWSCILRKPG